MPVNSSKPKFETRARRGSTLMIVMVLLSMLAVLGVVFYTFAHQERENSQYYAEAARRPQAEAEIDPDYYLNFALKQIIVGPDPRFKNSALWGGRNSLLPNMLGLANGQQPVGDKYPYTGAGIETEWNSGSLNFYRYQPAVHPVFNSPLANAGQKMPTFDFAGFPLSAINDSPAANNLVEQDMRNKPQPDVGYTAPDINNTFLAYDGFVNTPSGPRRVIIPSYHRPQYLRDGSGSPMPSTGTPNTNWFDATGLANRIFRPHPQHLYVWRDQTSAAPVTRFIDARPASPFYTPLPAGMSSGFPFGPMVSGFNSSSPTYSNGRQGVWTNPLPVVAGQEFYEYDCDNDMDKDSVMEGVWFDLDFPLQERAIDKKKFIPIYSATIYDLDGLINLSAAGNQQRVAQGITSISNTTNPFGTNTSTGNVQFISASNQGLGVAEINPGWALTARPSAAPGGDLLAGQNLNDYAKFYGMAPSQGATGIDAFREPSNMELFALLSGKLVFDPASTTVKDAWPGRYGEEGDLRKAFQGAGGGIPAAGRRAVDDNQNLYYGEEPTILPTALYPFVHPLDITGLGSIMKPNTISPLGYDITQVNTVSVGGTGKVVELKYTRYGSQGTVKWGSTSYGGGALMANSLSNTWGDDPYETRYYDDKDENDNLYAAKEMNGLALPDAKIDSLGDKTRLLKLAPLNFDHKYNARATDIRKRFTSISNDREQFSLPVTTRSWEFNVDTGGQTLKFPPQFGGVARYSASDPFRPELRFLLEIVSGDQNYSQAGVQRRLDITKLLTSKNNRLAYRTLTEHPTTLTSTAISTTLGGATPSYPSTGQFASAAEQEYFARKDRQQMARDIYVLLYTFCGGNDTTNVAAASPTYTLQQLYDMAHFAANLVDALDRDKVMTRFEFDTDLSDGWNLDDDPYTVDNASGQRKEVWGIERQDLTISEVLALKAPQIQNTMGTPTDNSITRWDETQDHYYAYIELRNVGPETITFSDTQAYATGSQNWQIEMSQTGATPAQQRRLLLKGGKTIAAGGLFTIGATDSANAQKSVMQYDSNKPASAMSPNPVWVNVVPPAGVSLDLDLVDTASTPFFTLTDAASPYGASLSGTDFSSAVTLSATAFAGATNQNVTFTLRRRANPYRTGAVPTTTTDDEDNPWIEVDSMILQGGTKNGLRVSTVSDSDTMSSTVATKLSTDFASQCRNEALYETGSVNMGSGNPSANTLGGDNSGSPTPFGLIHHHFDRDFANVMELLNLPTFGSEPLASGSTTIFGPSHLTDYLIETHRTPVQQLNSSVWTNPASKRTLSVAGKVLYPFVANGDPQNNRWHRLFEFIEVPTRINRNLGMGDEFAQVRTPGRINWNTIRHPEVLAALIDDEQVINMQTSYSAAVAGTATTPGLPSSIGTQLPDITEPATRDWWDQFIKARDSSLNDPFYGPLNLSLPGLPGSKPFRGFGYAGLDIGSTPSNLIPSIEYTPFRNLPVDGTGDARSLLEIGTNAQHNNGGTPGSEVDPLLRHRILAKIAGSTTNRSNTFVIFLSYKFFEAYQDPTTGAVRIGGPLAHLDSSGNPLVNADEKPEYTGFFVVDRSDLENAYDRSTGQFNYLALVKHRQLFKRY